MKSVDVDVLDQGNGDLLVKSRTAEGTGESVLDALDETTTNNLLTEYSRFRENPLDFVYTLARHLQGSSWRSYDNYVGHKLYYPGCSDELFEQTLAHPAISQCIQGLTDEQMKRESPMSEREASRRRLQVETWIASIAQSMILDMMARYDHKGVLRFLHYSVGQIFSRAYHQGVHVNGEEINRLRAKALELQEKRQSLIFLPCHRSHVDYIAIHLVCARMGFSLPVVVAGDNLNFAVIGAALRQVGAMYIRRSFNEDVLYQAVIKAFIETVLKNGFNFECFIEGTRSRTGKLLAPKFGILKYVLDAILNGTVEDSWIVPVSTQYDKVAEADVYANELMGREKRKENLSDFLKSRKIMSLQMGRVDVRFHEAWSLRAYIYDQLQSMTTSEIRWTFPAPESVLTAEMRTKILRSLGYTVLADINKVSVVMPTSLVGTIMLTATGSGLSFEGICRRAKWLMGRIYESGGRVGTMARDKTNDSAMIEALVNNGLTVLGSDLVGKDDKDLVVPIYYPKDLFKLSYYRNQVIHLFISEAVVTVALYTEIRRTNGGTRIRRANVLRTVSYLSSLLSGEFIFRSRGLQSNFEATLANLARQGLVRVAPDDADELIVEFTSATIDDHGYELFDFYCYLLWPFIDGFWLASVTLLALTPSLQEIDDFHAKNPGCSEKPTVWVQDKDLYSAAQVLGKTLCRQGKLTYFESVNKELLKSAFQQFQAEGIIIRRQVAGQRTQPAMVALSQDWQNTADQMRVRTSTREGLEAGDITPAGRLVDFSELISESRQKSLRHHDRAIRIRGLDMRILRMCHKEGLKMRSRTVQTVAEALHQAEQPIVKLSRKYKTETLAKL